MAATFFKLFFPDSHDDSSLKDYLYKQGLVEGSIDIWSEKEVIEQLGLYEPEFAWIAPVTLCPCSHLEKSYDTYTTNVCIIGPRLPVSTFINLWQCFVPTRTLTHIITRNWRALQFVENENISYELCRVAVDISDYEAIQYVPVSIQREHPDLCLNAVKTNGSLLKFVAAELRTPEICLAAVREDGFALKHVVEQTPEICLAAVRQDGQTIQFIPPEAQTPLLCSEAVNQCCDINALQYIHPSNQTRDLCLLAVQRYGEALEYVLSKTVEISTAAIHETGTALQYVSAEMQQANPELCLAAVQQDGFALKYVVEQTPEICLAAVQQHPLAIQYVKCLTPTITAAANAHEKTKTNKKGNRG